MAEYRVAAIPRPARHSEPESSEFPGCRTVCIPREAISDYEGRIEYWDAATEVAIVCDPVSVYHEQGGQRLGALTTMIAQTRGSPIDTFGAADLLVRDARGERQRIMQADQTVYLDPRATRPSGPAIEVGGDALPDVVLEVDNTTDVRRGKLALYGGFRTVPSSRAFPGWTAEEIHLALNEPELSDATTAALRRVGRALGAAEGTGPDDDPFLRAERVEGRLETQRAAVLQVFKTRGLPVSAALPRRLGQLQGVSTVALVQATLECRDEADFLRLVAHRR